jgi:hypothetical protein
MSRWLVVVALAMGVMGCSTRSVVVKPEEASRLNDAQWTIKSEPRR